MNNRTTRRILGVVSALLAVLLPALIITAVYSRTSDMAKEELEDYRLEQKSFSVNGFKGYFDGEYALITDIVSSPAGAPIDADGFVTIPNQIGGKDARLTSATFNFPATNRNIIRGVSLEEGNQYYVIEDCTLYNKDKTKVLYYFGNDKHIVIPDSVTEICDNAYNELNYVESVDFPDGLEKIDNGAFYRCSIDLITLPDSVTEVGVFAFGENYSSEINFSASLKTIGEYAFNAAWVREITLPEGLETVDANAFAECTNLNTLYLPSTLTSVASSAFYKCDNIQTLTVKCDSSVIADVKELSDINASPV